MQPWVEPGALPCAGRLQGVDLDEVVAAASELLWIWSGRQFGEGSSVVRPASLQRGCGCLPWWAYGASWGGWSTFGWYGRSFPEGWGCGCPSDRELILKGGNAQVTQVKVDGVILPPASYRVLSGRRLVRTDGAWPCCQVLHLDDSQPGTYSVAYDWGRKVPASGRIAAKALACELALAVSGDPSSKLPPRVTNLVRQGVTAIIQEPGAMLEKGLSGIVPVDLFITRFNPLGAQRQARVVSPDTVGNFREHG